MATITNWITHLTTDTDGATEGVQVGSSIYPGVGTETYLVIALIVIWIGWHFLQDNSESKQLKQLAKKKRSANDYKSNITDW
jgi:hypothetical protein